jgi:predicted nucleic acid-binding protein
MSRIVVDTDVASYIFNWHSLAQHYTEALRGSEPVLSFMSIAEMRMGAISARWGQRRRLLRVRFIQGSNWYTRTTTCVRFGRGFAPMRGRQAGH